MRFSSNTSFALNDKDSFDYVLKSTSFSVVCGFEFRDSCKVDMCSTSQAIPLPNSPTLYFLFF
ncbi:mCG146909 [Mus musculus]|nr:mCG146909 [Mus musculus]